MKSILRASVACAVLVAAAALNSSTLTAGPGVDSTRPLASMRRVTSELFSGVVRGRGAALAGVASFSQKGGPGKPATVETDKADYQPGDTAIITGSNFGASELVTLQVTHIDGTVEGGAGHEPWSVWTNAKGKFNSTWYVNPDDSGGSTLLLTAVGGTSGLTAQWTFTDNPAANLDQCRNGEFSTPNDCLDFGASQGSFGWVNGNAGPEHSHYAEGHSIPYRARMTELPVGGTVVLELGYDIKHGGKHALDFLTHYQRLSPHGGFGHGSEVVQPYDIVGNGVQGVSSTVSTFPIPVPDTTNSPVPGQPATRFNSLPVGERLMTLFGGEITGITYGTDGDLTAAQSETTILITFTPTADKNGVKTTTAVLGWGGHIARTADWGTGGAAGGAGTISGSPYHMRIKDWTGDPSLGNLGNQDRSLKVEAIFPIGDITIVKNTEGADGTFTFSSTGGGGLPDDFSITTVDGTDSITFSGALTGAKTVTEGALPNGWELLSVQCEEFPIGEGVPDGDSTGDTDTKTANIDLDGGERIVCTFVNKATGKLTVTKVVDNTGGGTLDVGDFDLFVDDFGPVTLDIASNVTLGTHIVTETEDPNYAATFSGDCDFEGSVEIGLGDDKTCTITNTFDPNPGIELVKSGSLDLGADAIATPGDVITYSFTVTNTGNVPLSNVTVTDPLLTVVGGPLATLAVGAVNSTTFTGTYALQQADIDAGVVDNTALATGTPPSGPADNVTDDDTHTEPISQTPSIALVKDGALDLGGDGIATPGDVITYAFTVTNTGNVTLSDVTVTDPLLTVVGGPLASLAAGAVDSTTFTGTYAITQLDIDAGVVDNTALATGTPPSGADVTDPGSHSEDVPQTPAIDLVKSGALDLGLDGIATPGDVITYAFTVTNTGNVTLSDVTVTDPLLTVVGGPLASLAVGAVDSTTFTGTYAITQLDIDAGVVNNTALATGTPPSGPNVTDPGSHSEDVPQTPAIDLVKSGSLDLGLDGIATVGDLINYTFTVTNTGNVTLTNVTVTDPKVTVVGGPLASLAAGAVDSTTVHGDLRADPGRHRRRPGRQHGARHGHPAERAERDGSRQSLRGRATDAGDRPREVGGAGSGS